MTEQELLKEVAELAESAKRSIETGVGMIGLKHEKYRRYQRDTLERAISLLRDIQELVNPGNYGPMMHYSEKPGGRRGGEAYPCPKT